MIVKGFEIVGMSRAARGRTPASFPFGRGWWCRHDGAIREPPWWRATPPGRRERYRR